MKTGYYVSLHAEILGDPVVPTSENMIDAHRTPILLLRASKAGIPTIPYLATDSVQRIMSRFVFPVVVFPANPFSYEGFKIAQNRSALYRAVKSIGMNYKFVVCAEPLLGEIITIKSIFGRCRQDRRFETISEKVYETFQIPICKLHVQLVENKLYLCGLQPLKREELAPSDMKSVYEGISQAPQLGEHLID